jgi:hypothetical protein
MWISRSERTCASGGREVPDAASREVEEPPVTTQPLDQLVDRHPDLSARRQITKQVGGDRLRLLELELLESWRSARRDGFHRRGKRTHQKEHGVRRRTTSRVPGVPARRSVLGA